MIALVRHPRLRGADGLCYGRSDLPLADALADIPPIAARLARLLPARIHTSPASRCRLVAEALGEDVSVDPRLQELDFGDWEGKPWADVPRVLLDRWAGNPFGFAPPNGESGASLVARVKHFMDELGHGQENHIVVSHAGPLKVLSCMLAGLEIDLFAKSMAFGSVVTAAYPLD